MAGGAAAAAAAVAWPAGRWLSRGRAGDARGPGLRADPEGVLDLHEGFSYAILQRAGARMDDGRRVPPRPDGMACFEGDDGAWILMRNHELPAGLRARLFGAAPSEAYDPAGAGAVTRLVVDPATLDVRRSNLVLAGTSTNCSGGASPWGWISCEEDPRGAHGYAFLCDPAADGVRAPVRIDGYGRFRHEAAAVRPEDAVCYLTEDRPDGCFYRFVPHDPSAPFDGRLQAMAVVGRDGCDTSPWAAGARREIRWIDLDDPTPRDDDLRHTARRAGAALVKRGEGVCFADGATYLTATTGGPVGGGQIFRLEDGADGGELEVVAASTDRRVMDMPDNVAVRPGGGLFFVEDGEGHDFLRGVRADGEVFDLARNAASEGELTGICFSPDGRTLLVNLQEDGLTLAIRGPFEALA
ncbi:MAG TPA: DUF839 domain-containing protein [Sandaracinaceae bacterium LLY-WYZ-13_1]|nr:DUF839 domain-containing protein [Sandaracinaceae bacterium LLY-WYZ-13_1]